MNHRGLTITVIAAGASALITGFVVNRSPTWALGLAGVVAVGTIGLRFPKITLIAVLPAAYGVHRLGPSAANLSVADGVLLMGTVAALPFVPWHSRRLHRALAGLAAYEGILALVVAAHPTARALLEWGHRILLVGGALLVGSALAQLNAIRPALRFYLTTSAIVAVAACSYAVAHHLGPPAYPFGVQKNDAGILLGLALLVAIAAAKSAAIPLRLIGPLRVLLILGLLATQSRGSMIATIIGLGTLQISGRGARRAAPAVVVGIIAMAAIIAIVSAREAARTRANPSGAAFYGIGARNTTDRQALRIWSDDPVVGAGLRYFRDPAFETTEPHNVIVISLGESGVLGLAALLLLLVTSWSALRGLSGELATLARIAFIVRFLAAMLDIFWAAGRGSLPWILIGLVVGAEALRPSTANQAAERPNKPLRLAGHTLGKGPVGRQVPEAQPYPNISRTTQRYMAL